MLDPQKVDEVVRHFNALVEMFERDDSQNTEQLKTLLNSHAEQREQINHLQNNLDNAELQVAEQKKVLEWLEKWKLQVVIQADNYENNGIMLTNMNNDDLLGQGPTLTAAVLNAISKEQ